jgi:hypothetical protein
VGGKGGGGGRGEKWPKPCMHIWIIKLKENVMCIYTERSNQVCNKPSDYQFQKKKTSILVDMDYGKIVNRTQILE